MLFSFLWFRIIDQRLLKKESSYAIWLLKINYLETKVGVCIEWFFSEEGRHQPSHSSNFDHFEKICEKHAEIAFDQKGCLFSHYRRVPRDLHLLARVQRRPDLPVQRQVRRQQDQQDRHHHGQLHHRGDRG